jgi:hypothetical protein
VGVNTREIYIEALVLEGVSPGDRDAVAEAFARELARLTVEPGSPPRAGAPRAADRLDAGTIQLEPGSPATALGTRIATAVHRSLTSGHER